MECDELSNNSTISNISENQNKFSLIFDTEEFTYTPSIEELKPEINNIVSTANLGTCLNLKFISLKIKNTEYNSNKNSTLIYKSKDNKVTMIIYSSGKMLCSGAKNEKESKSACIKFYKIVKKLGFNVELKDFKIQNIVACYDIKYKLSLLKLYYVINNLINNSKKLGNNNNYCKYNKDNKDNFPNIVFYINDEKIIINFFESGKIVISGAKKRKEIEEVFKNIYPLLIESKSINNEEQQK
jgi:transcription initiation factor TFIID TATA-box-binding protein